MIKKMSNSLIVGLDIGTSKIVALVGEINAGGEIEVMELGRILRAV
jgi:cell division protein FtsA